MKKINGKKINGVSKKFEMLSHTSEEMFKAYGKNLEEAFENSALAITAIMTKEKVKSKISKKIKIESNKKESLLYDFLEELVIIADTEAFIVSQAKVKIIKKEETFKLSAELKGDNANNYEINSQVKAITYNDMIIEEKKDKVTIQIVVDV